MQILAIIKQYWQSLQEQINDILEDEDWYV